jgi:hypothetical protein
MQMVLAVMQENNVYLQKLQASEAKGILRVCVSLHL